MESVGGGGGGGGGEVVEVTGNLLSLVVLVLET